MKRGRDLAVEGKSALLRGGDGFVNIAQARISFFFFSVLHRVLVIQNPAGTDLPNTDTV